MSDARARIEELKKQGFYDQEDRVRPGLFDESARDLGRTFAGKRKQPGHVSSSQLRGFYSEAKALETRLQEQSRERAPNQIGEGGVAEVVYQENEYLVRMLTAKVFYVQGKRTGGNVSEEFRDFIEAGVGRVRRAKDFAVFMRLFESVVGFYYGYGGGKN